MTYNPNIPQPTDTLSASQPQILTNFQQVETVFSEDHVPLTNGTVGDRGKHNKLTFTRQGVDYVADPSESLLYQKDNGGVACTYYSRTSAPNYLLIGKTIPTVGANGCTLLPGGILLQWGVANVPAGESGDITFPTPFSAVYNVQCSFIRAATTSVTSIYVLFGSVTNTKFRTLSTGTAANHNIYWLAIGLEA